MGSGESAYKMGDVGQSKESVLERSISLGSKLISKVLDHSLKCGKGIQLFCNPG